MTINRPAGAAFPYLVELDDATSPVRPRVTYELRPIDDDTTEMRLRFALGQLNGVGKIEWPRGKIVSPLVEHATRKVPARLATNLENHR